MNTMTHEEWKAKGRELFGPDWKEWVFVCPICKTPQTASEIMVIGDFSQEQVQTVLGFSCIGRFNNAGPYREAATPKKKGCDWTLGGLFHMPELEVAYTDDEEVERQRPVFVFEEKPSKGPCRRVCATRNEYEEGRCTREMGHSGICKDAGA